uniref:Calmodulin-lysine N-methyltransferase n=1 Tax=Wuchereria bancrofti TaxID=6293 RepID=A0A1I8EVC6_WUCBA
MDDVDRDKDDANGKRSMINEEELIVIPSKRSKEEVEKPSKVEVSKHEKSLSGTEVSKARQRWNLLSYHIRCNYKKQASDITTDVEATFMVFEAFFIPRHSNSGRWYHLKSPVGDVELDVHIYSVVTVTPNTLAGFNNSGNIRIWPSEECLAYYLLKHEQLIRSKTVLELGCGMVGLSGLTSAALGATEVVLTDGNEKSVENIQQIIETNKLSNHVTCFVLHWNAAIPKKQFDAILCADCLFFTEEHSTLLNCISRHLKPGGIAYVMAPDRGGTYQEIVDVVHYSCMLIQDEIVEELERKGQKMEFDKEVVAQVAFAICDTLSLTWPSELLQFAKHAKRSVINISDLKLLFRKNENMLSLIRNIAESSLLPARKRQSRKGTNKKSSKTIDSIEEMNNENSKDTNTLLSENKDTLTLTDFWNQPSTSRERSLLLSGTSKYTSATTEDKFLPNSESLQRKQVAAKKKEKLSCCKQKADITEPRKTDNRKGRQNQTTKQWLKPTFHLNGSELVEKQELESLDINIPCCSGEDLHAQRSQNVTSSWSKSSREERGINPKKEFDISVDTTDLCNAVEVNANNPVVNLELGSEIKSSTIAVASHKTASKIRANETEWNETESRIGSMLDERPIVAVETPVLSSTRINMRQFMDTSFRSSAADDCFSSFKFESDEDSDQGPSLVENKVTSDDAKSSPSSALLVNVRQQTIRTNTKSLVVEKVILIWMQLSLIFNYR